MSQVLDLKKIKHPSPKEVSADKSNVVETPKYEVISWDAPLFFHRPNLKAVFGTSLAMALVAVLVEIYQKSIITSAFFGLLAIIIIIYALRKPAIVRIEINPLGISMSGKKYTYKEIASFWTDYRPGAGVNELSIQLKKWHSPYIKLQIANQNPIHIRSFLIKFVPEIEHEETMADTIGRILGI